MSDPHRPGACASPASGPGRFGRALRLVTTLLAVFGGLTLVAVMLLSVLSILGRELLDRPVQGDFELVEIGCAVAVFAFLPYCQLVRGNVAVDFFTSRLSLSRKAALELIGNIVFAVAAAVLTWRMALGGLDLLSFGEETMVLRLPVWWGFVPGTLSLALLTLVCLYSCWRSLHEMRHGRRLPETGTAAGGKGRL